MDPTPQNRPLKTGSKNQFYVIYSWPQKEGEKVNNPLKSDFY